MDTMVVKPLARREQFKKLVKGEALKQVFSTGFPDLDEHIKVALGYLMIVTGYPGSGKSEWVDAFLLNMSLTQGWKTLFYSPENHPIETHMAKLAEKLVGKPITSFTPQELESSLSHLEKYFTWTDPEIPTLDTILSVAQTEKEDDGLQVLVVDPWNAVEHNQSEALISQYLSKALSKLIRFGRNNKILVIIIAHPKNPTKDKDGKFPDPTLYDIDGGAMWRNKADYGIIVHRPDMSKNAIQVRFQKIKFKHFGKIGMKELEYNYLNGRFKGLKDLEFRLPFSKDVPF